MQPLRFTPKATSAKGRAHELRFIQAQARLCRELGCKFIVRIKARTRKTLP